MTNDLRDVEFTVAAFSPLLEEAEAEGAVFLLRLRDEWHSGANRFAGSGECLLGVSRRGELVGVGGISHDPYGPAPGLGRVRHIYVLKAHRRQGIGRALVAALVERARGDFTSLRLRTRNAAAARMYEGLGFARSELPDETHRLAL